VKKLELEVEGLAGEELEDVGLGYDVYPCQKFPRVFASAILFSGLFVVHCFPNHQILRLNTVYVEDQSIGERGGQERY